MQEQKERQAVSHTVYTVGVGRKRTGKRERENDAELMLTSFSPF